MSFDCQVRSCVMTCLQRVMQCRAVVRELISSTDVGANPFDDFGGGSAGGEDLCDAEIAQRDDVLAGDDAAAEKNDVAGASGFELGLDCFKESHVRARQDAQTDSVGVFLHSGLRHLGSGLVQAGVNHLHASVAQGAGDDFGPTVMAVESWFSHDHTDGSIAACRHVT